jgi:hypothetical protein
MNLSKIPSTVLNQVLLERAIEKAEREIVRLSDSIDDIETKQMARRKELAHYRKLNAPPAKQLKTKN